MKKFTLSVLAVASLALTACGGGGDDAPVATSTPVATPTPAPTTSPTVTPPVNATYTGQAVSVDDNRATVANIGSNNIEELIVGGKSYSLTIPNVTLNVGGFINTKEGGRHMIASGNHMSYAKYGYYEDETADKEYFYYQGKKTPTASMPTTGTVTYTGRSIYDCDDCNDQVLMGKSAFTVDFGAKTLTGTVSNDKTTVNLSANISGNSFAGTHNGTTTNGAFFGANADELAGTYVNTAQEFGGAFGAKK